MFTGTRVLTFCLIVLLTLNLAEFSKILVILPYEAKSHFQTFNLYLKTLASRGHQLVVLSRFPRSEPIPNYIDIDLRALTNQSKQQHQDFAVFTFENIQGDGLMKGIQRRVNYAAKACRSFFDHPDVMRLIQSDSKFDLVVAELFVTDCFLTLAFKFKTPIVAMQSCALVPWSNSRMGNVDNPSYIPVLFTSYASKMNFIERTMNVLSYAVHNVLYSPLYDAPNYKLAKERFRQDMPQSSSDIVKNTSLILVNSHFSLQTSRPFVPGIVEVGGIHIGPVRKLPQDLEDYLNGAEHGVIYFSMGSMIRAETLPPEKRDAFLQAFSELPQRVLWKWEGETLPGQPKNVKIAKWLPQFDILNHPNVRIFLAHGGLLGTIEAVHVGVPMVGIPMYGDQSTNIRMVEAAGMGIRLNYADITKETVLKALKTVLDNTSYAENARKTSRAFRDRPMSPMDTAIYWTEYVIRHKGAPHLRTAGADLPLYQYLLLDVIAVLLLGALTVLYVFYFILKKTLSLCFGKSKKADSEKKRK